VSRDPRSFTSAVDPRGSWQGAGKSSFWTVLGLSRNAARGRVSRSGSIRPEGTTGKRDQYNGDGTFRVVTAHRAIASLLVSAFRRGASPTWW
jgi:hypothetical protein